MSLELCGTIEYYAVPFEVYWDLRDKTVTVKMPNNPRFPPIHNREYTAESKEDALNVAIKILKKEFGRT